MRTKTLAAVLLALALAGCAADAASPGEEDCGASPEAATWIEDALALGLASDGAPAGFQPVVDGASLELVLGSQGGWMITPILAVDRSMMASDGACVDVAVEVDLGIGGEPFAFQVTVPELGGTDQHFYSEPLPVFLSYDLAELDGRTASITAVVTDDDVASSCQVAALLTNRE
jgi:hypothetical protein